jgi:hypothetical protein
MSKKNYTNELREDLLIDVGYGDTTFTNVYTWMYLLALREIKIITNRESHNIYLPLCYDLERRSWIRNDSV